MVVLQDSLRRARSRKAPSTALGPASDQKNKRQENEKARHVGRIDEKWAGIENLQENGAEIEAPRVDMNATIAQVSDQIFETDSKVGERTTVHLRTSNHMLPEILEEVTSCGRQEIDQSQRPPKIKFVLRKPESLLSAIGSDEADVLRRAIEHREALDALKQLEAAAAAEAAAAHEEDRQRHLKGLPPRKRTAQGRVVRVVDGVEYERVGGGWAPLLSTSSLWRPRDEIRLRRLHEKQSEATEAPARWRSAASVDSAKLPLCGPNPRPVASAFTIEETTRLPPLGNVQIRIRRGSM
jgi:hypothetical protein